MALTWKLPCSLKKTTDLSKFIAGLWGAMLSYTLINSFLKGPEGSFVLSFLSKFCDNEFESCNMTVFIQSCVTMRCAIRDCTVPCTSDVFLPF